MSLNFGALPRVYKILLFSKMIRLRKMFHILNLILKKLGFRTEISNIIRNFITLIFIISLFANLFTASSAFDVTTGDGWIQNYHYMDDDNVMIYIAAVYWSTVTCATVGYGDILPRNNFEISLTNIIIVGGVALFSYALSDLST